MSSISGGSGAAFAPWTAQRVEVYLALPDTAGRLVTLSGASVADAAGDPDGALPRLPGVVLAHGEHPRDAALRALQGAASLTARLRRIPRRNDLRVRQVHSDVRRLPGHPGLHVLRLVVEPDRGLPWPVDESLLHGPAPAPVTDVVPGAPPRVQRPAAYAVVVVDGEVLLSRVTGTDLWTLPGGGVDHGEHPDDAVRRETLEETGLHLAAAHLVDVDSLHFTGRSPAAVTEDFHGVRLLYRGAVRGRARPAVQEVGGTTEEAAWWPVSAIDRLRLSSVVRVGLARAGCRAG